MCPVARVQVKALKMEIHRSQKSFFDLSFTAQEKGEELLKGCSYEYLEEKPSKRSIFGSTVTIRLRVEVDFM
jgi:hypothetical protein